MTAPSALQTPDRHLARASQSRQKARDLFHSPRAFATPLVCWAWDRFGPELLEWHPTTLRMEIADEIGTPPSPAVFDRLMAGLAILRDDQFYNKPFVFANVAAVLSGDRFDPAHPDMADVLDCAWAVTEAALLHGPDPQYKDERYSSEVVSYIAAVMEQEGYTDPPTALKFAAPRDPSAAWEQFGDDPEFAQSIAGGKRQLRDDLEQTIMESLRDLLRQVTSLELENGDTRRLRNRIAPMLSGSGKETAWR